MVLKGVLAAVIGVALLAGAGSSASMADGYKADEFLSLDLSKAALSPKLLGPPAQFEPVPVEARADSRSRAAHARQEPRAAPKTKAAPKIRVAHVRAEKHHGVARTKLVRRHTNPLDAQAFDTRIQVWPCRSGGICNWQRPAQGE
jgi:hypothetical protein